MRLKEEATDEQHKILKNYTFNFCEICVNLRVTNAVNSNHRELFSKNQKKIGKFSSTFELQYGTTYFFNLSICIMKFYITTPF